MSGACVLSCSVSIPQYAGNHHFLWNMHFFMIYDIGVTLAGPLTLPAPLCYIPLLSRVATTIGFSLPILLSVSLDLLLYNIWGHIFQFLSLISKLVCSLRVFKFLPHFSRIGFFDCLRNVICEMFCSYTRLSKKGQTINLFI